MDLNIAPAFRIVANDRDVTAAIVDRFKSLRLTDEAGVTSDTLEINLADHDPEQPIIMPPVGAELQLSIGYGDRLRAMGMFIVDEIELAGPPDSMTIRARAAPYEASKGGKTDLQTQKSRAWKAGVTIGAMVRKIAGEHGMQASVSDSLAAVVLPHIDQSAESDMNFLHRLAKRYDAIAKPAGGRLLFVERGASKSASGQALPRINLVRKAAAEHRFTLAMRDSPGTVVGYYRETHKAKRHEVRIGEGDPVKVIRTQFRDKSTAVAAVKAEQSRRARGESSLSLGMPGDPAVIAESVLVLGEGYRKEIAGDWLVTRAEHYIGPQGYRTTVECERPNSDAAVAKAKAGNVTDQVQTGTAVDP